MDLNQRNGFSVSVSILVVAMSLAMNANAGQVLRLKAGTISVAQGVSPSLTLSATATGPRYLVIQFEHKIKEADKKALKALGIETKGYLPDDALVVKGEPAAVAKAIGTVPGARAALAMDSGWKISRELRAGDAAKKLILVRTIEKATTQKVAASIAQLGAAVKSQSGRMILIETSAAKAAAIGEIEGVEFVQAMPKLQTSDFSMEGDVDSSHASFGFEGLTGFESGTRVMGFSEAWSRGYNGAGQVVAMADTGTDIGQLGGLHPDLNSAVVKGYPMGLLNFSWADGQGHGTHVSGSVVGSGKQSDGILKGGAHGAKFVAEGMFNPLLKKFLVETDFEKLMGTPYSNDGARIHTNSWGAAQNFGSYDTLAAAADEAMWNRPELLILFAAGNSGEDKNGDGRIDENSIGTPGTAKNVLTVGASENQVAVGGNQKMHKELRHGNNSWQAEPIGSDTLSNNPNGIACFSSRGPTNDGRIKPEIVAPGTNILSTRSRQKGAEDLWGRYNDDYVWAGGTSMATPLTAGAATVTRGYLASAKGVSSPSGALVKAALIHTATDLFPGQYGTGPKQELPTRRPNVHEGYGRVNMAEATALGNATVVDNKTGVATAEDVSVTVNVSGGEGLRATLVWTDAPAAASASKTLVNDLDLIVAGPSGRVTKDDHTNNAEMVELASAPAGQYTITVRGTSVPNGKEGKQPYALLVSRVKSRR